VRFAFIHEHRDQFPVTLCCLVLNVSRSGYYAWQGRAPSATHRRRQELTEQIQEIHRDSQQNYGSPKIYRELQARGVACNRKTVAKYMKTAGIRSKVVPPFRVVTTDSNHSHPVAENLVNRNFQPSGKNEIWLSDITYIPTGEGWLYLAAVEDLYTREIIGWSMSEQMESRLVVDALQMALSRSGSGTNLIAHSDRGVQYASDHYQRLLRQHGIRCSMSRKGNCWDNAPMESFFASLKKELVHHQEFPNREQARQSLFQYIEVFYNRKRRHSAIGYQMPSKFAEAC
jgi:putative transposase